MVLRGPRRSNAPGLPDCSAITNRIYAVVGTLRSIHDEVDTADPSTSDVLHDIIDALEKEAWMLKSENGKV